MTDDIDYEFCKKAEQATEKGKGLNVPPLREEPKIQQHQDSKPRSNMRNLTLHVHYLSYDDHT